MYTLSKLASSVHIVKVLCSPEQMISCFGSVSMTVKCWVRMYLYVTQEEPLRLYCLHTSYAY